MLAGPQRHHGCVGGGALWQAQAARDSRWRAGVLEGVPGGLVGRRPGSWTHAAPPARPPACRHALSAHAGQHGGSYLMLYNWASASVERLFAAHSPEFVSWCALLAASQPCLPHLSRPDWLAHNAFSSCAHAPPWPAPQVPPAAGGLPPRRLRLRLLLRLGAAGGAAGRVAGSAGGASARPRAGGQGERGAEGVASLLPPPWKGAWHIVRKVWFAWWIACPLPSPPAHRAHALQELRHRLAEEIPACPPLRQATPYLGGWAGRLAAVNCHPALPPAPACIAALTGMRSQARGHPLGRCPRCPPSLLGVQTRTCTALTSGRWAAACAPTTCPTAP